MNPSNRGENNERPLDAFDELQKIDDDFDPAGGSEGRAGDVPSTGDPSRGDLDRLEQKYRAVLEVGTRLTSTLDLNDLLNQILDGVLKVTGCERALLMLREDDGTFSMHLGRTRGRMEWRQEALWISRTVVERVVESGEALIESNILEVEDLRDIGSIHERNIRSAFCFPLRYQGDMVGVIYADSSFVVPQVLAADHSILDAFGAQAAVVIENARRHGELETTREKLEEQNFSLRKQLGEQFSFAGMISRNSEMLKVFDTVKRIAPHDINVLIHGGSGTGKELLARAIHDMSPRREAPFVAVNCTAIVEGLAESALFGHRKGAFTGALADKAGYFELADGGTLFLDEIGDMPPSAQPKILRAVQEGEIQRVGEESRTRSVNVRIICATHHDLGALIEKGKFRADLFYRLNEAYVSLPGLSERREDIVPLAEYFLEKYRKEKGGPKLTLSDDARRLLMERSWKGNIRELQSAINWGIAFQDENHVIHAADLARMFENTSGDTAPRPAPAGAGDGTLRSRLRAFERREIREALDRNKGNMTSTAKELGISRQQLYNKVRDFKIRAKRK